MSTSIFLQSITISMLFTLTCCHQQTKSDTYQALVEYDQKNKCFNFVDRSSDKIWIANSGVIFTCNTKDYPIDKMVLEEMSSSLTSSTFGDGVSNIYKFIAEDGLKFGFEAVTYHKTDWISINAWVENTGTQILTLNKVRLIDAPEGMLLGNEPDNWRVLDGASEHLSKIGEARNNGIQRLTGRSIIALHNPANGSEAVMGFSINHAWGNISIATEKGRPHLTVDVDLDIDLPPRGKVYAETFHLKKGTATSDITELISATGYEAGALVKGESFGGWCSWYGFNPFIDNDITEDAVLEFASAANDSKEELPLRVMLLDDGYFTLPGDWTTLRPTFPSGMKYLTEEVKKQGLIPGIWVAASIVHENSNAIKQHPQWVDIDDEGKPRHQQFNWGGTTHSFDISNPEVLHHIDSLFRVIVHDWGFKYLKLDFNIEPGPHRKDRSITPFTAMRNMYKTIRKAVGEDVILANCAGSPYPPSIGYVQAGRVGPDVNPNWESVLEGCRKSILHIPFHRRWWVNDPDCLNMREAGSQLTDSELQTHLTANFMCGGYVMFSDSLTKLSPKRLKMLAQALPSYGQAAEILDLMTAPKEGIPSLLNIPVDKFGENYTITTIFNWSEAPTSRQIKMEDLGLDPKQTYHIYDFWTDTYKGIFKDIYTIENQAPHSCRLLAIRPVKKEQIQIISTNLHLLQGTMEIKDITRMNTSPFDAAKEEIWIEIEPVSLRNGKLILAASDGLRIASSQGCQARLEKREDGLWDLHLHTIKDKAALVLRVR